MLIITSTVYLLYIIIMYKMVTSMLKPRTCIERIRGQQEASGVFPTAMENESPRYTFGNHAVYAPRSIVSVSSSLAPGMWPIVNDASMVSSFFLPVVMHEFGNYKPKME
jgi:hypothetical protein